MSAKKFKDFYLRAVDLESLGIVVAFIHGAGPDETLEAKANAVLLNEALAIKQETDFTPCQLAEQRVDLLDALLEIDVICTESRSDLRKRMGTRVGNVLVVACEAIAKAQGGAK